VVGARSDDSNCGLMDGRRAERTVRLGAGESGDVVSPIRGSAGHMIWLSRLKSLSRPRRST
jgi:hypothetical protein